MSKFKAVLSAAAALVATGLTIGVALNQAGQSEGMTTQEWCAAIERVQDVQRQEHFFVAFQPGSPIPPTNGGRLLGDCTDGECVIAPDAAPDCSYTYSYDCGPAVDGWRVCDVWAHPYIARGWQLAAGENAWLKWFGSLSEVVDACLTHTTGAKCLQLLDADNKCWRLSGDRVCRYGRLLGAEEGADACPYADVVSRFPCVVYRGAGSEWLESERVWTEEEMDAL